jgi:PAS domain S-box-containing protein
VNSELAEKISQIEPGGHLCLFYDKDPAEQMPALIPFIQEALAKDEQFIYIADDYTVDALTPRLSESGIDVGQEAKSGRLKLWTRKEWRQPGELSSDKKAEQVRQFVADAEKAGYKGVRFAVEMTWTLGPDISAHKLEHWEATINTLFESHFPGRIVCQYNRSRLSADVLLAALHTHPDLVLGDEIYANFFYKAPLILGPNGNGNGHLNGKASKAQLEWMIGQLQRARELEKERENLVRRYCNLARQKEAAETNNRLAAIVECSDDAIISKNLEGIITSWNKGAERVFGYSEQEVIGKSITILMPPDRVNEEPGILARITRGERIDHYETVRRRKDGKLLHISLTVSPVRNADGQIIGASKIARDITEQKRAEEELRHAKNELAAVNQTLERRVEERTASLREVIAQMEEFSYSVSHDLRGPARAMQGYAAAVLEDYGDRLDARGRDYVDRIIRGSTRMDRLIQDVLTYSRIARTEVRLQPVSLQKLVPEILQQYVNSPRAETSIRNELHTVLAHEPSLTQAISNLLCNAVKFVAPGVMPKIQIWSERHGKNIRLWIEDNGIGIRPEHQRRLFGMFERVHQNQAYEGTGIGLAIVRKAVEKMGGVVGVESDGFTGSSFWIELPAAEQSTLR